MRIPLLILFMLAAGFAHAQLSIPFGFTSEEKNKLIKETDSVRYYRATRDTSHMVSINEETFWYRLVTKDYKTIAEGGYMVEEDKYMQEGRAFSCHTNGNIKLSGFYHRGKPIGMWQAFYPGGQLKAIYNYGIILDELGFSTCFSGSYQEFYESGKIKVNGYYGAKMAEVTDTIEVEDPVSGEVVNKTVTHFTHSPLKTGHWEYYAENGELNKKEDY